MLDQRIEFVRPDFYPKQFAAIYDPHKFAVIEASTKSGKTSGCVAWLSEQASMGKPYQNHWWVAPVSGQADMAFTRMLGALGHEVAAAHLNPRRLTLFNGAVIWFKSGDRPDTLYGEDVYSCVVDEASRFKEGAWQAVLSTLTYTNGPIRVIGNVKGRKNWFYQLARRAEKGDPEMGYHRLTAHDAIEAGVLKADVVESMRRQMPERVFRELYLAEASDDEGNPFGFDAIQNCIGPMSEAQPIVWGWDLAKSRDWTVGIGLDSKGNVCRFERFHGGTWDDIERRILNTAQSGVPLLVDSTGVGDPIVERLQKRHPRVIGYQFTMPSKQKLMEGLAAAIHKKEIRYPQGPISMELEQFEYEYRPTGVRYAAMEGAHDDCVCALALAVQQLAHRPAPAGEQRMRGMW